GLVSEQSLYNLTARTIELEVIPACRHFGLSIIPYSPLAEGALGGALSSPEGDRRGSADVQEKIKHLEPQLKRYEKLCKELGAHPATVALAWLLHNPAVTAPIIGPRTMQQLEDSIPAVSLKLDEETLSKLDEIWPGPGGEAPEAYAW
ncbi:MAG: aldo/keto reductase, partial [Anaerolineales bacterium]